MNLSSWIVVAVFLYLGLNFVCALALHVHGERQAHLPPRFLDVLAHFVLLTAFALPVLMVITAEAMFGHSERSARKVATAEARAA